MRRLHFLAERVSHRTHADGLWIFWYAYLALQAEAQVLLAPHSGLVDADAQAAVARREGRGHDLLDPDHVPEQPKVAHAPGELAAAQTRHVSSDHGWAGLPR